MARGLRLWFTDGVYSDPSIDSDFVFNEMSDYFQAWSDTVNHDEYTFMPGVERWKPYFGGTKSTLERPNHVKKLMLLTFPWIRETMLAKQLTLDLAGFKEILSPLKYVDWHNTNFSSGSLISTGEDATNWLQIWIKQSILNGNQWTLDDVNSTDPSLVNHGRALHASPSEPDFDFIVRLLRVLSNLHGCMEMYSQFQRWLHFTDQDTMIMTYLVPQRGK